jgi:hypothetical protein
MTFPLPDPHGTHLPVLCAAVATIRSHELIEHKLPVAPVLELGVGNYSTFVLHELCRSHGIPLVSLDGDAEWLGRFSDLANDRHIVQQVDRNSWDAVPLETPEAFGFGLRQWGVAFIDHAGPDKARGERRVHEIKRLAQTARIIVVHDTEEAGYKYEPVLATFKYRYDYKRMRPWTTAVSNFINVQEIFG